MGQEVQRILELIEKTILSTMYVSQINGTNPIEVIKEKSMFSNELFRYSGYLVGHGKYEFSRY